LILTINQWFSNGFASGPILYIRQVMAQKKLLKSNMKQICLAMHTACAYKQAQKHI